MTTNGLTCYVSSVSACYRLKRKLSTEQGSKKSRLDSIEQKRVARVPEFNYEFVEVDEAASVINSVADLHGQAEENIQYALTAPGEDA